MINTTSLDNHLSMAEKPFNILGLCNGSQNGNSEILLKAALKSVESSSERPTKISWVHVPSVEIPRNPMPLKNSADISLGHVQSMKAGVLASDAPADDRRAILDAIHSGELAKVEYETYDVFNLHVTSLQTMTVCTPNIFSRCKRRCKQV